MEVITLSLWGQSFVDCFSLGSNFRGNQVMHDDACLSYIHSGTQEICTPSGKIIAKNGESILTKCGSFVAKNIGENSTSGFSSIIFHLNLKTIKKAFEGKDIGFLTIERESKKIESSVKFNNNQLIENFVASMTLYFENPDLAKEEIMVLKLQELVYILCDSAENPLAAQIIGSLQSQEQVSFEDIISANLYSNLNINELAHLTTRSESSFKRDFKKWYQVSPAKYLKTKRLEKAADLLKNTKLRVNEIAWDCGFENAAHFGASFLTSYGKTPNDYRV